MPKTYVVYIRSTDGTWTLNRPFNSQIRADRHADAWVRLNVPAIVIPIDRDERGVPDAIEVV